MYDVAIIGAGPAGSYTAYLLAKEGYNVILLDRNPDPDPEASLVLSPVCDSGQGSGNDGVICTGIVSKEAFKRFSLPEDTILKDIRSVRFISPSGETFRYEHHSAFAYILDRSAFNRSLLRQALKKGVTFLSACTVEEVNITKKGVELFCKNHSISFNVRAKVSVIGSGINISLLKMAGLKGPQDFLMGAQIEASFIKADEVEIYLGNKVAPESFAWIVPLGNGRAKIGLLTKRNAVTYLKNILNVPSIRERLQEVNPEIKYRLIPFGYAQKTYGLRILSVGDAAGQVKTTTGGGIYYGLIGAELVSQTLQKSFSNGDFTPSTLKVYEMKWHEVLGPEINTGIWLRNIYARLGDKKIDHLIRIANSDGIVPLIKNKAKFDWQKGFFLSLLAKPVIKHLLDNGER